jgi:hypothetical protein
MSFTIGVGVSYEYAEIKAGKLDINEYIRECNGKLRECRLSCKSDNYGGGNLYVNLSEYES